MAMVSPSGKVQFWRTLLVPMLVALPSSAQEAGRKEPELSVLAKSGHATLSRLEKQAATWTATTQLSGNARVVVEIVTTPGQRRCLLRIEAQRQRTEALRIIMRDGVWYATEGRKAG